MASIHKRPNSKFWHAAYYLPDGRRTLRSTGTTDRRTAKAICLEFEKAARLGQDRRFTEARAREAIADIYALANADKLPMATASDFLKSWLTVKELEIAERSVADYRKAVDEFKKSLGPKCDAPIDSITTREVIAFRGQLAARVSSGTVNKYLLCLRGAWKLATVQGLTRENVFAKVGKVRESDRRERRAFTLPELTSILEAAGNTEWRGIVLFGLYTGQRLSDIAGLTYRNLDLSKGEVTLVTKKTRRRMLLPLSEPLLAHLLTLPSSDSPDSPVFPESYAALSVNQSTLSRQFGELLADAGLVVKQTHEKKTGRSKDSRRASGGLSFHCLRHTATSLLKNAGVSDVIAREIIGHDSEAVSRVYTHIESATLKRAISQMPDVTTPKK